jgi:hypothetical protein
VDIVTTEISSPNTAANQGCLKQAMWLGAGFVLPCASFTFYRHAAKRKVALAVAFFLIFTAAITLLSTITVGQAMFLTTRNIKQSFADGDFPEIIIEDGIAEVEGPQPNILFAEQGSAFIIDTTGAIQELDRTQYHQGFLLTKHSLHILNKREYQEVSLQDLHDAFNQNPIIVNADTVTTLWGGISVVFVILAFVGIALWNLVGRLMYIAFVALIFWGITSLIRPKTDFGPVLVSGLYAFVPAYYFHYLLGRVGIRFIFLQTLILIPIWILALLANLWDGGPQLISGTRTPRLWRAFIGIPALALFSLDAIFHWEKGPWLIWPTALLTMFVFIVIDTLTLQTSPEPEPAELPTIYAVTDEHQELEPISYDENNQ